MTVRQGIGCLLALLFAGASPYPARGESRAECIQKCFAENKPPGQGDCAKALTDALRDCSKIWREQRDRGVSGAFKSSDAAAAKSAKADCDKKAREDSKKCRENLAKAKEDAENKRDECVKNCPPEKEKPAAPAGQAPPTSEHPTEHPTKR